MARTDSLLIVATAPWTAQDGSVQPVGTIVTRMAWDGLTKHEPPPGTMFQPDNGEKVWRPVPDVPPEVTIWQLQIVLAGMPSGQGNKSLLEDANALAAQVGGAVEIAWTKAPTIRRDSVNLAHLAPQLGLTEGQVDAAFMAALGVTA